MDAVGSGHMLVVPCRRLAPLLPMQQQGSMKRGLRKESIHGAISHRKLLKIAAVTADYSPGNVSSPPAATTAAAASSNSARAGFASSDTDGGNGDADGSTVNGGGVVNNDGNDDNDDDAAPTVSERLADVLDSMYQAAGPAGVLLVAGVTRRRSPCGRYDVNTLALQHEQQQQHTGAGGKHVSPIPTSHSPRFFFKAAEAAFFVISSSSSAVFMSFSFCLSHHVLETHMCSLI